MTQGERVVTSGLGQNFPADLLVGQVLSVALDSGACIRKRASAAWLIRSAGDRQVITNFEPVDLGL